MVNASPAGSASDHGVISESITSSDYDLGEEEGITNEDTISPGKETPHPGNIPLETEPTNGIRINKNSDFETADSVLSKEASHLKDALNESIGLDECDIIILIVHGASFASSILANNLKDFLNTLDRVQKTWFWELAPLNIHVEMIDWKSVLSPFQNKLMAKVVPLAHWNRASGSTGRMPDHPDSKDEENHHTDSSSTSSKSHEPSTLKGLLRWVSADNAMSLFGGSANANDNNKTNVQIAIEKDNPETGQKVADVQPSSETPESKRIEENITDFNELTKRYGHRLYFNNTIADVLCYLTPRFGNFMTNEICKLLNNKISALRADPSGKFKRSKVVLVGHSLGSVILFELLTGLKCREVHHSGCTNGSEEETCVIPEAPLPPIELDNNPQVNFPVSHFFMWGSPLGSFLLLQNRKELSVSRPSPFLSYPDPVRRDSLVKTRFYNIFHKSDPVAMRIEPIFYPNMSEVPMPVMLPNFKTNGDTDWRRGIDLVTDTSTIKAAATHMFGRLFTSNTGRPVSGMTEAEVEKCVNSDRYAMPDALNKNRRYGVTEVNYGPSERTGGIRLSEDLSNQSPVTGLGMTQYSSAPDLCRNSSFSSVQGAMSKTSTMEEHRTSFEVGKGDVGDLSSVVESATRRFMFARKAKRRDPTVTLKPWTARQWALQLARRIRRKTSRIVEERLADRQILSEVPKLREAAYHAINIYIEDFLKSCVSGSVTSANASDDISDRMAWLKACRMSDQNNTDWICRKELNEEMNREVSEEEIQGGDQLPVRLDFAVSETFQEFVLAPLGLLQSHLNYWGCNDTVLFMLKEMAGFRPRLPKERRDHILSMAQKTRHKIVMKLEKLIPPPGSG